MVHLDRIYTRSGDKGYTGLGDGTRTNKTDLRVIAYGAVDELNAALGMTLTADCPTERGVDIRSVQNDLFDLGADLSVPQTDGGQSASLRINTEYVSRLESLIDEVNQSLQPLSSFILPGGNRFAAYLHVARTICRRAEVTVWQLAQRDAINPQICVYLNRLSDLLFVWARSANNDGQQDVLWQPGRES